MMKAKRMYMEKKRKCVCSGRKKTLEYCYRLYTVENISLLFFNSQPLCIVFFPLTNRLYFCSGIKRKKKCKQHQLCTKEAKIIKKNNK